MLHYKFLARHKKSDDILDNWDPCQESQCKLSTKKNRGCMKKIRYIIKEVNEIYHKGKEKNLLQG